MDDLILLILSSPSGAGKTTLTKYLLDELPEFTFSVSHTTRKPRAGEIDGMHYHFVDRGGFDTIRSVGGFAEWAEVHGNLYGTSLAELDRARAQGKHGIVFDIDYQGARQIKATRPEAIGVFVLPPSLEILRKRLEGRGTDDPAVIDRRFHHAKVEIEHYGFFDYVLVNDQLELSKRVLLGIALAERHRRVRMAPQAESLLRTGRV